MLHTSYNPMEHNAAASYVWQNYNNSQSHSQSLRHQKINVHNEWLHVNIDQNIRSTAQSTSPYIQASQHHLVAPNNPLSSGPYAPISKATYSSNNFGSCNYTFDMQHDSRIPNNIISNSTSTSIPIPFHQNQNFQPNGINNDQIIDHSNLSEQDLHQYQNFSSLDSHSSSFLNVSQLPSFNAQANQQNSANYSNRKIPAKDRSFVTDPNLGVSSLKTNPILAPKCGSADASQITGDKTIFFD